MGLLLYNIIIYPIESIAELAYVIFFKLFENEGIALVGISLVLSILTLPLYNMADTIQKREREKKDSLRPGIEKIKTVFSGDEQYMILSTFYKQNHYHPAYALRNSLSLLIQVPFFVAAYHFVANLEAIQGIGFLFIQDLGLPDALLSFGSIDINILPFIMTLVNLVSGYIYSKGFHNSEKIQLYSVSFLFLLLLYNSPSGLVFYWTLNNIFSLVKNEFYQLKNPVKFLHVGGSVGVVILGIVVIALNPGIDTIKIVMIVMACFAVIFAPNLFKIVTYIYDQYLSKINKKQRSSLFSLSCLSLWVLCGLIIPSNLISSSTTEFAFIGNVDNPLQYLLHLNMIFFGIFCFWPIALYMLFDEKVKNFLTFLMGIFSISAFMNVFVFSDTYGTVNALLQFEIFKEVFSSIWLNIIGLLFVFICFFGCIILIGKGKSRYLSGFLLIVLIASIVTGIMNIWKIQREYRVYVFNLQKNNAVSSPNYKQIEPIYDLSKENKNVFVIILDRAISSYFPEIIAQFPEVKDQYKGFVYYPNTVSLGAYTVSGTPSLMSGYEYSPEMINQRPDEKLYEKHNEALLAIPKNFLDAGFQVTLTDIPLVNYQWGGDLSLFDEYPEMNVSEVIGDYTEYFLEEHEGRLGYSDDLSFFVKKYMQGFSFFKIATPLLRPLIYDKGQYFSVQLFEDKYWKFLKSYTQLHYLDRLTGTSANQDTYTLIHNNTTHEPVLLQAPEYEPQEIVTNIETPFSDSETQRHYDITTYHVNAAAIKEIGNWLDYLRKNEVFDNTRIIIISDHGRNVYTRAFADFDLLNYEYAHYNALMLVKDFSSNENLKTDMTFMTIADTPLLSIEDLNVSSINPFTGNDLLDFVDKEEVNLYFAPWNPTNNNTFEFDYSLSYSVKDNIFIPSNWNAIKK